MKDKDKYYLPEIEEFHPGFEYEVKWNEEKIIPYTFPNYPRVGIDWGPMRDRIAIIENLLSSKDNVRVKYLDGEDIESLGFVFKGGDTHLTYHYGGYAITHTPSNNKINIYYYDGSEFVNAITIKNKSELKKLLKMLNIL